MKIRIEETEEWRLPAGEMLFQEGRHAEHFFVLLEGEIVVWKKQGDQEIVVTRNRPPARFSAKLRFYSALLTCCPVAPRGIAG